MLSNFLKNAIYYTGLVFKKLAGYILIVVAVLISVACLTYNAFDNSWNNVSSEVTSSNNLLGSFGANISDFFFQTFGLGTILIVACLFIWGLKFLFKQKLSWQALRIFALLVAVISVCAVLSLFSFSDSWNINTGMGGIIGFWMQSSFVDFLTRPVFMVGFSALAILAGNYAIGLTITELTASLGKLLAVVAVPFMFFKSLFKSERKITRSIPNVPRSSVGSTLGSSSTGSATTNITFPTKEVAEVDEEEEKYLGMISKKSSVKKAKPQQRLLDLGVVEDKFELPSIELLRKPVFLTRGEEVSEKALSQNARLLEKVLEDFGVNGEITQIRPGPVVTLYELEPAAGTKSSRVIGLSDDIARSMSAMSARISVVRGKNAIGIELPNSRKETVYLREIIQSEEFKNNKLKLPLALGKDIGGSSVIVDLAKMPHLLVAGTTGSGKSVAINTMILSLIYNMPPSRCKFIMIDPKMLELSIYDDIPHLLAPVVTEPGKAVVALKWVVGEMESRYKLMSNLGVRNIDSFNEKIEKAIKNNEDLSRTVQTGFNPDTGQPIYETVPIECKKMPFIVVIVDEMADLMVVAGKDIEGSVQRLAQMARAAGIHIVMATQRPSVDVITGIIKANFPTRISFQVTSKIDSRTIIGEGGAEQLLGHGDMLYMSGGGAGDRLKRIHGPFVSDEEVKSIVDFAKSQGKAEYDESVTTAAEDGNFNLEDAMSAPDMGGIEGLDLNDEDSLFNKAVQIAVQDKKTSISYIQRRLRVGYNKAATLIERMEQEGVVSRPNHAGKRELLIGGEGE